MTAVRGVWVVCIGLVALVLGAAPAHAAEPVALGPELLARLPADVVGAFSVDNATSLRQSELGEAISRWMVEQDAMPQTRRAWGLFASRIGVTEVEAFDGLLGGCAVLAFARRDEAAPLDWVVLAAVETAMDVRMIRRTRAVPRKIVHGRAVLGLEEESFLLATLPPMDDGRSVLALAPAGAEWLLLRTLAASAGKADLLESDPLRMSPADAAVRGFWRPQGSAGVFGDLERMLWGPSEAAHTLSLWASVRMGTVEIGLSPTVGERTAAPEPSPAGEGVLLDVTGPGAGIVASVLERAGLVGLVPEGLEVTRQTGELVVRRGPEGVELGARLPVDPVGAQAGLNASRPIARLGQARIRALSETPGSRAIFGPNALLAWTVLQAEADRADLLLAVTAGPGEAIAPSNTDQPTARAVDIIAEATGRPGPDTTVIRGSARPHELWSLLRPAGKAPGPAAARGGASGFASVAALVERARWAIGTASGAVRGRIVLEFRGAARN